MREDILYVPESQLLEKKSKKILLEFDFPTVFRKIRPDAMALCSLR